MASPSQPSADCGENICSDVLLPAFFPLFLFRVTNGSTFISGKMAAGKSAPPCKATLVSSGRYQPSAAPGLSPFVVVSWELK